MELWTALAIGFFGSFHCIGMCGPIAMALPGKDDSILSLLTGRLAYNVGRVVTYSMMGALFGLMGHSIALAGFQQSLSVLVGIIVIASVVLQSNFLSSFKQRLGINYLYERLKKLISAQFKKRGITTLLTIGLLNGFLPCGLVYLGLAGSITTGSILQGSLFMILFGIGTMPAMFAMAVAPGLISLSWRRRINKTIPYIAVIFGAYLIYRGIAFGSMMH